MQFRSWAKWHRILLTLSWIAAVVWIVVYGRTDPVVLAVIAVPLLVLLIHLPGYLVRARARRPESAKWSGRSLVGSTNELRLQVESMHAPHYFRLSGAMCLTLDPAARIVMINEKAVEALGYESGGELLGQEWLTVCLTGSFRHEMRTYLQQILGGMAKALRCEAPYINRSGDSSIISWTLTGVADSSNAVVGVLISGEDISMRKRAERESARLSSAMKMSREGIVLLTPDGTITDVNAATLAMFGGDDPAELIGRNAMTLIEPEDRQKGRAALAELLERGKVRDHEYRVQAKSGEIKTVEMAVSIVRDANGDPEGLVSILRDVGERKRDEERLRLAAEASSDLIYEWDTKTGELLWFGDIDGALGYEPGAIPQTIDGWLAQIHPDDLARLSASVERHQTCTDTIFEEYRIRHRDGSWRYWVDRGAPACEGDGLPQRWIGACIDITEREHSKEVLRKRALQLQMVSELGQRLSSILDLDKLLAYLVRAIQTRFGFYHVDVFLIDREGAYATYHSGSSAKDDAIWRSEELRYAVGQEGLVGLVASTGEGLLVNDVAHHDRYLPDERRPETKAELVVPIRSDGRVVGVLDIQSDEIEAFAEDDMAVMLTLCGQLATAIENARLYQAAQQELAERRRVEQALRESEKRYRTLVEEIPLAVYDGDLDWNAVRVNSRIEDICGYSAASVMAGDVQWTDLIHPEDRAWVLGEGDQLIQAGGILAQTYRVVREDGSVAWVEDTKSARQDPQGRITGIHGILKDITVQKQAEQEKLAIERRLLQAQRLESVGTLASGIAHEINNPLTGIINYAQLIHDRIHDPSLSEFAGGIIDEGNRVARIVQDLLAFSRQEKERHSPAHLRDIIDATMSLIGAVLRRDQILLEVIVREDVPVVNCRSQQIQQVLLNLLTNARDSLNQRYPGYDENKILALTVMPGVLDGQLVARIEVEDHGGGIPADQMDRIFDPFFTTKPRDRGTGLGLSVSYGIIRDHRGRLMAESVPDDYTRFVVELPVNSEWAFTEQIKGPGE